MRVKTALILLAMLALIVACAKEPVCGNLQVEKGETPETCCADAGCPGEQSCVNNTCQDPECKGCSYLDTENHICVDYECCDDTGCSSEEKCIEHKCEQISCAECEYAENRKCKRYACCEDEDCDDNDASTADTCKYPSTKTAECTHTSLNECEDDEDCDDKNVSTTDSCSSGTPRVCRNVLITKCIDDDDYCPPGCDYTEDDDCEKNITECDDDDIDCFYDALEDCKLAELTWTVNDETNSSVNKEITTDMSIEGKDNDDKCKIYFRTKRVELEFTDGYKDDLEDLNYTASEIDDMESDAQNHADNVEGYDWTCYFEDYGDAIDILNEWEDGDYTIAMFEDYCTGDYFD